ncbi:hypothetical protein SOM61_21085 [Massilia sp. CFBP9012]|uniref:hypothetical protein n=1 Tax=Massilia sp. CFBP9012 TaxID=3096531 RepID=UPI002A6A52CA|nr:hypothetical protein [Massilia sp. CFBP9012]MDY0977462.1 hypothetical protein [Massilia sp. CFBP9012]
MHIKQVRFDRIFDVQERTGDFSFEDGGWPVYGVNANGLTIPREGATYAVAFAEAGNWEKVIGWRDLAVSNVEIKRSAWSLAIQTLPWQYMMIPVPFGISLALGGYWAAVPVAGLMLLAFGAFIYRAAWRNRQAAQALQEVHPAVPPAPGKRKPSRLAQSIWALAPILWK